MCQTSLCLPTPGAMQKSIERMKSAPELPDSMVDIGNPETTPWGDVHIHCSDEVSAPAPEATMLSFVHEHTSIPVPRVRLYFPNKWYGYLLMEKIPGKRLDRLWFSYSPLQKFLAAWTLRRRYVRQLRQASAAHNRRHIPGPTSDKPPRSFQIIQGAAGKTTDDEKGLGDTQPLVLTHGYIRLCNVMSAADTDEADHSWIKYMPVVTVGAYAITKWEYFEMRNLFGGGYY
ncbi:hypothetical protein BDP27DRAFT_1371861 [Rhodocollybia butyracea]|uniref:Uncharacterized protein n=1 Tax=Rhodocollybia butyracea TaxID=206335 RepID=A0A9P5TXT1_9AGAR|nr:hypothetical protein BDP27DRAFT_1371861 [Rhodocollybia butyracea]